MDKNCCTIQNSRCGRRGSHHAPANPPKDPGCLCTDCEPNTRIVDRLSAPSMAAIIDWAGTLPPREMKEFSGIVMAF